MFETNNTGSHFATVNELRRRQKEVRWEEELKMSMFKKKKKNHY